MRTLTTYLAHHPLFVFAAYFAVSGIVAAALAYPLWLAVGFEFDKVLSRLAILTAAVLLIPMLRLFALSRQEVGLVGADRKQMFTFWWLGLALMVPPCIAFMLIDFRVFDPRVLEDGGEFVRVSLMAVVSGALVGFFEEVLFRGLLLALWQRVQPYLAVVGSSMVYAVVHFVEASEPASMPGWGSGFAQLAASFAPLAHPGEHWDSFIGLFLLGVGLCWLRNAYGSLWPCIAVHASVVTWLKIYKDITIRDIDVPMAWVVGSYDNFVGELTAVWLLIVFAAVYLWRATRNPSS